MDIKAPLLYRNPREAIEGVKRARLLCGLDEAGAPRLWMAVISTGAVYVWPYGTGENAAREYLIKRKMQNATLSQI